MTKTEHAEAKARCEAKPWLAGWVRTSILNGARKDTEAALEAREKDIAAFKELAAVLGTGLCGVNTCEGCEWEAREAVRLVSERISEWDGDDPTPPRQHVISYQSPEFAGGTRAGSTSYTSRTRISAGGRE